METNDAVDASQLKRFQEADAIVWKMVGKRQCPMILSAHSHEIRICKAVSTLPLRKWHDASSLPFCKAKTASATRNHQHINFIFKTRFGLTDIKPVPM
ncbi:MAG: hypothetical protein OXD29_02920 [Roseovarius sp.]|nr:hypothetical protein [Roseovarius sp.]MCY4206887.1 hypothetical protein [Roseovarius sp.]